MNTLTRLSAVCLLGLIACSAVLAQDLPTKAYFEIAINKESVGYMNFNLRPDVVPKTVKNFTVQFAVYAHLDADLLPRYIGTYFHRIIPDFMVQGGDVERNSLPNANTERVPSFNDENFELKHVGAGILSMANAGPNTNSSQFFITTVATPWLDGRHVVFGKITEDSTEVLKRIEATGSASGRPSAEVTVKDAGLGHKNNS